MLPTNSTSIVEEIQQPQAEAMKEDTPAAAQAPKNEELETPQEVQTESTKATLEVKETTQNMEALVQPDDSQTTISGQPTEETAANASAWLEWMMGEQPEVAGTSNQPPQQEDRVYIPSSPRKKPAT
jgi:hypothetical protein